jgi:hypothetical protein
MRVFPRLPSVFVCSPIAMQRHRPPPRVRSVENISKKRHQHRDLSAPLRSGRDDKGEGSASEREVAE